VAHHSEPVWAVNQGIMKRAAMRCIALALDAEEDPGASWTTASEHTSNAGRVMPPRRAQEVVKRVSKTERVDVIEIICGPAELEGPAPINAVQTDNEVPHRTASAWIKKARAAARLGKMTSMVNPF